MWILSSFISRGKFFTEVFDTLHAKTEIYFQNLGKFLKYLHPIFKTGQMFTVNSCFLKFIYFCQNTLGKLWLCWLHRKKLLFVPEYLDHLLLLLAALVQDFLISQVDKSQISSELHLICPLPGCTLLMEVMVAVVGFGVEGRTRSGCDRMEDGLDGSISL